MKIAIITSLLISSCVAAHEVLYERSNEIHDNIHERDAGYGAPDPSYGAPSPSYGGTATGYSNGNEVDAQTAVSFFVFLEFCFCCYINVHVQ